MPTTITVSTDGETLVRVKIEGQLVGTLGPDLIEQQFELPDGGLRIVEVEEFVETVEEPPVDPEPPVEPDPDVLPEA